MAIQKVLGIETEYGIIVRGGDSNPIAASSILINAYVQELARAGAATGASRVGWDFEDEQPGNDARGFNAEGQMPPEVETHLVNAVLTNGARYYVDHAHPELSTPGVRRPTVDRRVRPGRRADPAPLDGGRHRAPARGPGDRRLQEQLRPQGQQLRHPRELPDGPGGPVLEDRPLRDAALHHPADLHRGRQGRHRRPPGSPAPTCRTSSRSAPTSSRRRSASRRR